MKTSVEIIFDHFRILDDDHVLTTLYEDVHVAKINVLFNVFYCRSDDDNLVVIIRIKEFYFSSVLSIRIDIFRSFYKIKRINKINKINKIRRCTNFFNKILQSILLLLKKVDVLLRDIRHNSER